MRVSMRRKETRQLCPSELISDCLVNLQIQNLVTAKYHKLQCYQIWNIYTVDNYAI